MIKLFSKREWLKAATSSVIATALVVTPVSATAETKKKAVPTQETESDALENPNRVFNADPFNEKTQNLLDTLDELKKINTTLQDSSDSVHEFNKKLKKENLQLQNKNKELQQEIERLK